MRRGGDCGEKEEEMKRTIEIEFEVDGEATEDQIETALLKLFPHGGICSEDIDGTKDYAILVNSIFLFPAKSK